MAIAQQADDQSIDQPVLSHEHAAHFLFHGGDPSAGRGDPFLQFFSRHEWLERTVAAHFRYRQCESVTAGAKRPGAGRLSEKGAGISRVMSAETFGKAGQRFPGGAGGGGEFPGYPLVADHPVPEVAGGV